MHPRVMGHESERATIATCNGQPMQDFWNGRFREIFDNCLPGRLAPIHPTNKENFLPNGAMICIDTGFHFEYAGQEAAYPRDAVVYEGAADRFVAIMVENINRRLAPEGIRITMFKQNLSAKQIKAGGKDDEEDETYGAHESYLMERASYAKQNDFFWKWAPFIVTSNLFAGAGRVYCDPKGILRYELSQRSHKIIREMDTATTSSRAILNLRNQPHCGPESDFEKKYWRLHVIMRDANIAEVALLLKYGTMEIVLDMIETGFLSKAPFGQDWRIVDLLHIFSEDPGLRTEFSIEGKGYSIIDMQEVYYGLAQRFFSCGAGEYTDERKKVMEYWGGAIDDSRLSRPHERLADRFDWAAKKLYLEKEGEKLGYMFGRSGKVRIKKREEKDGTKTSGNQPITAYTRAKFIDINYHRDDDKSIARRLLRSGGLIRITSDEEIEAAIYSPIDTEGRRTRAYARAEQLKWVQAHMEEWNALERSRNDSRTIVNFLSWDHFWLTNGHVFTGNFNPWNSDPQLPETFVPGPARTATIPTPEINEQHAGDDG